MDNIFKTSKNLKWLLIVITIFLAVVIILFLALGFYDMRFQNKIFLGVKVAGISLGGKNVDQAKTLLQTKVDNLADKGIIFSYKDKDYRVLPIVAVDDESSQVYELWSYDVKSAIEQAYGLGRDEGIWQNNIKRLSYLLKDKKIEIEYKLNQGKIIQLVRDNFVEYENPGKDANLVWKNNKIMIAEEETGMSFDYQQVIESLLKELAEVNSNKIELVLEVDEPHIIKSEVEFLTTQVGELLKLAPITLKLIVPEYYQGRKRFNVIEWYVNYQQLQDWLRIKLDQNKQPVIGLNEDLVKEYLLDIATIVDTPAQDAKFNVENGKVVEWQSSEDGFVLNINETFNSLDRLVMANNKEVIELTLTMQRSQITNENVNDMGVRELFGVGESDFSGSPLNRRHNIKTGAEALNGLLIAPAEEFSLMTNLGEIDAANGYLPELVIKDGRTIPEYGGGLCQIGTTAFRLAINAGLPVTERRNHSYRVGYYEPAGTDATVYNPWPDFKFINDSQEYLLLQTRIEGNKLIFEFWGTPDGRQVATTSPVIYNIVKPGEAEYIETDGLAPGEKKLLEHAHNGADAQFERTIIWPESLGRETIEEIWSSHYVPWREKWLIGVEVSEATTTDVLVE